MKWLVFWMAVAVLTTAAPLAATPDIGTWEALGISTLIWAGIVGYFISLK